MESPDQTGSISTLAAMSVSPAYAPPQIQTRVHKVSLQFHTSQIMDVFEAAARGEIKEFLRVTWQVG